MKREFNSEAALTGAAANLAKRWRDNDVTTLCVGLRGPLGAGKTTWVRAALAGLGYGGRVPSPTYTLLEEYCVNALTLVHLDLYRFNDPGELEYLGVRDRFGESGVWFFVEWPERAPSLLEKCDLVLDFAPVGATGRRVTFSAQTRVGDAALEHVR
ncbi:MAG TPA: tRNA (adenosine(37)-N6)-threonylcarbamoyltransferase complex ATPase subunit type 1 TsaE [Gammaproteobacteria bacterium]